MFHLKQNTTYYHTCPLCGANLDPGESCDCQKEQSTAPKVTEKSDNNMNERGVMKNE